MPERARLRPRTEPARRDPTPSLQEYEENLTINEHELQIECRNQPELFYHVACDLGEARVQFEDAKAKLKRCSAEVELEVRHQAEIEEVKMTESKCAALVLSDQRVLDKIDAVGAARERREQLEALKESYYQRGDMLKELVGLHLGNYYADPARGSISRNAAVEGVRASRRRDREEENSND